MFDIRNRDFRLSLGLRCANCNHRIESLHGGCVVYVVPLAPSHSRTGSLVHRGCMEREVRQLRGGEDEEEDEHIPVRVITLESALKFVINSLLHAPLVVAEETPKSQGTATQRVKIFGVRQAFPS